jgi:hypothetical protein
MKDQTLHEYQLIDYSKPKNQWKPVKISNLTIDEAHTINRAFGLNGITKRYIKND